MTIRSVEFAGAVAQPDQPVPVPVSALPQIAFVGRSNVGKSSLINRLLGRTRTPVARVSARPGKTREINFYRVRAAAQSRDLEFALVDLPGYGYARVPLTVRGAWKALVEGFLSGSTRLKGVVQLIDARHGPAASDLRMVEYLAAVGVPVLFAATKIDRVGRAARRAQLDRVSEVLGADDEQVVPFSANTGEGRQELLASLISLLLEMEDGS